MEFQTSRANCSLAATLAPGKAWRSRRCCRTRRWKAARPVEPLGWAMPRWIRRFAGGCLGSGNRKDQISQAISMIVLVCARGKHLRMSAKCKNTRHKKGASSQGCLLLQTSEGCRLFKHPKDSGLGFQGMDGILGNARASRHWSCFRAMVGIHEMGRDQGNGGPMRRTSALEVQCLG